VDWYQFASGGSVSWTPRRRQAAAASTQAGPFPHRDARERLQEGSADTDDHLVRGTQVFDGTIEDGTPRLLDCAIGDLANLTADQVPAFGDCKV
jgi:hypothetical protein